MLRDQDIAQGENGTLRLLTRRSKSDLDGNERIASTS